MKLTQFINIECCFEPVLVTRFDKSYIEHQTDT